jgi:hypothetical protein
MELLVHPQEGLQEYWEGLMVELLNLHLHQ